VAGNGQQCPAPTDACGDNRPAVDASLNTPHDVAALPGGGFLIADTFDNRIRQVDASGTMTTVAGTGELCEPSYTCCCATGAGRCCSAAWPTTACCPTCPEAYRGPT
jgi:NHL repeat-containing protein